MKPVKDVTRHLQETQRLKVQKSIADNRAVNAEVEAKRLKNAPVTKQEKNATQLGAKHLKVYAKEVGKDLRAQQSKDPRRMRVTQQ